MLGQSNLTYMPTFKFVCTRFVHFYVSVVCEWGSLDNVVYHRQSQASPPTWILFFTSTLMSNFVLLTEKHMGNRLKIGNRKHGDPFLWSNTVPYLCCQAQIPSLKNKFHGFTYLNDTKKKRAGSDLTAHAKRLEKMVVWRQIMKRDCISLKMSVFSFWHITTTTHNLY